MKSCPSSEIELPDKGTGCGHFIKVVMWTLLGIFGFILLIYLIFAIALNEAQEKAYESKTPDKSGYVKYGVKKSAGWAKTWEDEYRNTLDEGGKK